MFTPMTMFRMKNMLKRRFKGSAGWLSRKSKAFDDWINEEDHHLRGFTNTKKLRKCILEHVRKRKRGLNELERLDEK